VTVDLELGPAGPRIDGRPVRDLGSLEATLGPPSRTVRVEREIPGLEGGSVPDRVHVWDEAGLIAAPGLLVVAVGDNLLDEPVWPLHRFSGAVLVGDAPLDYAGMTLDPLREQRRHADLEGASLVVLTDWRGTPTKVVWRQAPG
jgi:hypothetical protein